MRHYLQILFFIVCGFTANAAIYNVSVTNIMYTPAVLVINQGDQVVWTNNGGFHNVNGTIADNPTNPESFTSGAPAGAGWIYSKTFTLSGTYEYFCDVHGVGMAGIITVNGALPIELQSITAIVNQSMCKIEWKTDKEENLSMFTLQKSTNALDFKDLVDISANHVPSTYSYMDDMGIEQYVYYRVKIKDENNSVKYTPIRLAQNDMKITKNTLTLLPNPYVDHFHISVQSIKDWAGAIMVYDITGRVVYNERYVFSEGNNYVHLDNSDKFPKGLYVVAVRNVNNKEVLSATVIKQ